MDVDLSIVKELRQKTGAGIMAVKKALDESGGNSDKAEEAAFMNAYCYYLDSPVYSLEQSSTKKAIDESGKKAAVVVVSALSNRLHTVEIDPKDDRIHSLKDHEWNLKFLEYLEKGRLEDVSQL